MQYPTLAPGTRITLRTEDFMVTKTFPAKIKKDNFGKDAGLESFVIECEGVSPLVQGKRFTFDLAIDEAKIVDPKETILVADTSNNYQLTRLYFESRMRTADVSGTDMSLARKAALNVAEYQFEPTRIALAQPFARILIADAVGLGKTAEVGILLTELMRRGRAKRVLVLALKSILAQFQQELWDRFAFPLVRLDSDGVAKLRAELPSNKNPFDYYDRVIVSIDTLKKNGRFQHYLERTRWDVVVIDECHNVANVASQRGGLAQLLARRCDNLIFTSATPHNGKNEYFANLMRMLEPTVVERETTKKDVPFDLEKVKQHVVRRAKKDLPRNVQTNFRDRSLHKVSATLLPPEIDFLAWQQSYKTDEIEAQNGKNLDALFSIGLLKAYLSSPQAACTSIEKRIKENTRRLEVDADPNLQGKNYKPLSDRVKNRLEKELEKLPDGLAYVRQVLAQAEKLTAGSAETNDAKLNALFALLDKLKWKGTKKSDRIVLFAERVDTLEYLEGAIAQRFGLKISGTTEVSGHSITEGIARFDGSLTDTQQQRVIDDFGRKDSKTRLLLTSDAGSQGVNLHYECHQMVNYDLPWSLITLEQRNGRIDRYGQTEEPNIYYIIAESELEGLSTDLRIVENIRAKEEQAYKTLGDAGAVMKLYDNEAEERATALAMATSNTEFLEQAPKDEATKEAAGLDFLNQLGKQTATTEKSPDLFNVKPEGEQLTSLYSDDAAYYHDLLDYLQAKKIVKESELTREDDHLLHVDLTRELRDRLFGVPREALTGKRLSLSLKPASVMKAMSDARKKQGEWSKFQLLFDAHPLARQWAMQLQMSVKKNEAPVARLRTLPAGEVFYLMYGQATNAMGTSLLSTFYVVGFDQDGEPLETPILTFDEFWRKPQIQNAAETWTNRTTDKATLARLQNWLPDAVRLGKSFHVDPALAKLRQRMQHRELDYRKELTEWYGSELDLDATIADGKPTARTRDQVYYREGLRRYTRYTEMRQGTHVQVLGVLHNL